MRNCSYSLISNAGQSNESIAFVTFGVAKVLKAFGNYFQQGIGVISEAVSGSINEQFLEGNLITNNAEYAVGPSVSS